MSSRNFRTYVGFLLIVGIINCCPGYQVTATSSSAEPASNEQEEANINRSSGMHSVYNYRDANLNHSSNITKTDDNTALLASSSSVLLPAVAAAASTTSYHSLSYYGACYAAGAASSSIRWVLNPLELVKVRMQVAKHQYPSILAGLSVIVQQSGVPGLFQGVVPTGIAYMFQTSVKYGTYEVLKDRVIPQIVSPEVYKNNPGLVYIAAAACAEAVADVFMCPWEMLKVKMQTANLQSATTGGASPFPQTTFAGLRHLIKHRKEYNFPFGSLGPLWFRQIPGTVVNFYTFENISNFIYKFLQRREKDYEGNVPKTKNEFARSTQLLVTLVSGYVAGFLSSVVSHPADSLVSLMNQPKYKHSSVFQVIQDVGWRRLATYGLLPRILVTGKIICFQWILYDTFKNLLLGGNNLHKQSIEHKKKAETE